MRKGDSHEVENIVQCEYFAHGNDGTPSHSRTTGTDLPEFLWIVTVTDPTGSPVQGVYVKMYASLSTEIDFENATVYGTTNSNGQVTLYKRLCPDGNPITALYMKVSIGNEDFTVLSSSNTSTTLYTVLYPEFEVVHITDGDILNDISELYLAEKFKPVLHKHSWDEQAGLSSVEWLLSGKSTLKGYNILGQKVYDSVINSPADIHDWSGSTWDSFGEGQSWRFWQLDIHNTYRHQEAPVGQRPLYYHVYMEGNYYYVQYWMFFGMNDVSNQTENHTWHEGDFEHVSLKINSSLVPVAVNFYRHEGGRTISPSECWWSSGATQTYSGISQGYSSSKTHLHIWVAANSHASYNRYDKVFRLTASFPIDPCISLQPNEFVIDNVDYEPSNHDLYFTYDYLKKMGEYDFSNQAHGYVYVGGHNQPVEQSIVWLTFIGRFGQYWAETCFGFPIAHMSPLSPVFDTTEKPSHEWLRFTENYSQFGFGNPLEYIPFQNVSIIFVDDITDGD